MDDSVELQQYVRWFEQFAHDGHDMLQEAERACSYYDGKQLDEAQIKALKERNQPPVVYNRVKRKIDYLVGMEKQQRTDPKAYPRTPQHEQDAHAATDALRYQSEVTDYDVIRSAAWYDIIKVGWGGTQKVLRRKGEEVEIRTARCPWDRMWWDIHSSELDYSDAQYLGMVRWMDFEAAVREYGEDKREILETAKSESSKTEHQTLDDKPKYTWYDRGNNRIRICQVYCKKGDGWHFAEFTNHAMLVEPSLSPFVDDDGLPYHPYNWQSAYVDRENCRYGLIRELFDPQDEVNKRRSKLLHYLNAQQTYADDTAIEDENKFKQEMAKPNGHVKINAGAQWGLNVGVIPSDGDVAGHAQLLQEAKNEIDLLGANAALQGKADGVQSGKAIQAQQQGGLIELGGLLDQLRQLDKQNYRSDWLLIRKYWGAEKWIRITDDEKNVRFVGFNVPFQDPKTGQIRIVQPAQMDVDIYIEDAPDTITLAGETFEAMVTLANTGVVLPPEAYVEAAPNLRNKEKILELIEQQKAQQMQAMQMQQQAEAQNPDKAIEAAKAEAEINKKNAETAKTQVEAAEIVARNSVAI